MEKKKQSKIDKLRNRIKSKKEETMVEEKTEKLPIYHNYLGRIEKDFVIRITDSKVIIQDNTTYLKFSPEEMSDVILEKDGDKLIVSIEKGDK